MGSLTDREVAVCMPPLPLRHVINGHPHQLHAYRCIAMQHACRGPVGFCRPSRTQARMELPRWHRPPVCQVPVSILRTREGWQRACGCC